MRFIVTATLILVIASIGIAFVVQGGFTRKRRQAKGFWRRFWLRQVLLVPVYVFVLLPGLVGCAGSRLVRTRGDEASYAGPILRDGRWILQDRQTLKQAPLPGTVQPPIEIPNPGGPTLRAYFVPSRAVSPRATVILVHGLFRSAMEVEPIAEVFRELGCEVLLLNLRNHGGSEARPFTYGLHEKTDLLAAVEYLRTRPGGLSAPLIVYGVSMGAVIAARAAPEISELAGLVLDAPMTNLVDTTFRQLGSSEWQGQRGFGIPAFYISLVLFYMELASGFDIADIRPVDQIAELSGDVHSLFIGAGLDLRVPPPVVRAAFEAHRAPTTHKTLWIEPDATHGRVWQRRPSEYRGHLAAFLDRATRR